MFLAPYVTSVPSGSLSHFRAPASTSPVTILSASLGRVHASVFNHSSASLYLRFDDNFSNINDFDVKLSSGSYYEFPKPVYQGAVKGVWDVAGGFAMICDMFNSNVGA